MYIGRLLRLEESTADQQATRESFRFSGLSPQPAQTGQQSCTQLAKSLLPRNHGLQEPSLVHSSPSNAIHTHATTTELASGTRRLDASV